MGGITQGVGVGAPVVEGVGVGVKTGVGVIVTQGVAVGNGGGVTHGPGMGLGVGVSSEFAWALFWARVVSDPTMTTSRLKASKMDFFMKTSYIVSSFQRLVYVGLPYYGFPYNR